MRTETYKGCITRSLMFPCFNQNWSVSENVTTIHQYEISCSGYRVLTYGWMDRQTDVANLIGTFLQLSIANVVNNVKYYVCLNIYAIR
jgi:hypothetical protein